MGLGAVLERATSSLGVPVSIHRFVPAPTPTPEATVTAALEHLVGFVDELSLMLDFRRDDFEMAPVEIAAGHLAAIIIDRLIGPLFRARSQEITDDPSAGHGIRMLGASECFVFKEAAICSL
ncbi:uncharacterized protein ATNIH1004_000866 [Aspergillus tanneri]|uniref:Uncharacterized protein n=1 Tax=Aspergillus tanneri TaxID=1220188 RepID=A0A5M9N132_9EURO|nr:uncharacterized protein ATNIH1004_000866 [Aspergillus tanneri]KAA8651966.1 hypothetical protein ATNIH1004_000866 [Aspergillus tanneri]